MPDVAIVGAGILGCAAAAELAAAGAEVVVHERERVAAGASGRNSGSIQHPLDPVLAPLYEEGVATYSELGVIAGAPDGVLVLGDRKAHAELQSPS